MMQQPLQQQLKIRVYAWSAQPAKDSYTTRGGNYASYGTSTFMDIEDCVKWGVTYEEQASLLNTLTFTVDKNADVLLHKFRVGQWVTLFGGFYSEDSLGVRKVFSGTVTRIKSYFANNGMLSFTVEAMSIGYTKMGKDNSYYLYPDKNSPRDFCKGKTSISLRDLIKGIVEECNMTVGEIAIPKPYANVVFTESNVRHQKAMSDWKFINKLAEDYGCYVRTDVVDGQEMFYFTDKGKRDASMTSDISFLYPLQGKGGITEVHGSEIIRMADPSWNRPRLLYDVVVDEDISMAYAVSRSAIYFDKSTGEYVNTIAEVLTDSEGKKTLYRYTLDEARVRQIEDTNPTLADQIRNGSVDMQWSSGCARVEDESPKFARYYYKQTKIGDENVAVFDKAFFGIYLTAKCNQDLNIHSQRVYAVRGILRYSTVGDMGKYFLRGLKHIWEEDGNITELDLIY